MSLIIGIDQLGDTIHVAVRRIKSGEPTPLTEKVANCLAMAVRKDLERQVEAGLIETVKLSIDNDPTINI